MREGVEHYSQIRALQAAERSDVALVVADAIEGLTDSDLSAVDRVGARALRDAAGDQQVGPRPAGPRAHPRAAALQVAPAPADRGLLGGDGGGAAPAAAGRAAPGGALPGAHLDARAQRGAARAGRGAARPAPRASGACRCATWCRRARRRPTFRLEVNDRSLMTRDYGFWLENRLRQRFDLDGVPLVIEVRDARLSRRGSWPGAARPRVGVSGPSGLLNRPFTPGPGHARGAVATVGRPRPHPDPEVPPDGRADDREPAPTPVGRARERPRSPARRSAVAGCGGSSSETGREPGRGGLVRPRRQPVLPRGHDRLRRAPVDPGRRPRQALPGLPGAARRSSTTPCSRTT